MRGGAGGRRGEVGAGGVGEEGWRGVREKEGGRRREEGRGKSYILACPVNSYFLTVYDRYQTKHYPNSTPLSPFSMKLKLFTMSFALSTRWKGLDPPNPTFQNHTSSQTKLTFTRKNENIFINKEKCT